MSRKFKVFFSICLFLMAGLAVNFVFAQDFGTNEVNNVILLSSTDPRAIIGKIIQITLGFLGVLAISLIVYAGFIWMTSNGEEEKIDQAKKILKNAIIGLVIILSAWSITIFIINKLGGATGFGNNPNTTTTTTINTGLGAVGSCTVESFYPDQGQGDVARNTSIITSFKEEINENSVCVDASGASCACNPTTCNLADPEIFRLYKSDLGDACGETSCPPVNTNITDLVAILSNNHKTIIFTPLTFLGDSSNDTEYTMKITSGLQNVDGNSIFSTCNPNKLEWSFTVNTDLDLTPPMVSLNGVFPAPDNEKDIEGVITPANNAIASITVNNCPNTYIEATVSDIMPSGPSVFLDYHGDIDHFKVLIPTGQIDKAQLFNGNDNSLIGIADFDNDIAIFPGYFSFQAPNRNIGDLWTITINPEQLADTITAGSMLYTFAKNSQNNNIMVEDICTMNQQALNIQAKLSGNPDIDVTRTNNIVNLSAKVAGESGNSLLLETTNTAALVLSSFSGGSDQEIINEIKDRPDNPMNSIIQLNFNEAINPLTVAGTADEVANYIRVVNADVNSLDGGAACTADIDCRSYNCENSSCQGDYLAGHFLVSNVYQTVEFISDDECGVNGCGEKIYCLPANSNLSVELVSANLQSCQSDSDCISFSPFNVCGTTDLGYKTCQNKNNNNYPIADLLVLDGVVDAALNSLDGNRDAFSDGPSTFYNDNVGDISKKDKYKFSFNVSDQIFVNPPKITLIYPSQSQSEVELANEIEVNFDTLMMNSSLKTGSVINYVGNAPVEHKLLNLRSLSPEPLGFWIANENKDVYPLDGIPDLTSSYIEHSLFAESANYKVQVGSGVKDVYQNCFKPSIGPGCSATESLPSCCFGSATNILGPDGNCQ